MSSIESNTSAGLWCDFAQHLSSLNQGDSSEQDGSARPILGRHLVEEKPFTRADISHINKLLNSSQLITQDLDIEILRSDPNHPLHSKKTFQEMNLNEPLLKGIASMGFYKPSAIQEKALYSLISSRPQNMIAQSQSGTGKTATFLMAMLSRVKVEEQFCQCLCLAPTRELAMQIATVGRKMASFCTGVTFGLAVRDATASADSQGYVKDQIVIGTPGTVAQWVRGSGAYRIDPSRLNVFVLDEADVMIEQEGFLNISLRIKQKLSSTCQILLFSATYEEEVIEFAREFVPNPVEIRVTRTELPLKNIRQFHMLFTDWQEKYEALTDIYGGFDVGQAIIFCATRKEAAWLQGRMEYNGHRVAILSGDLTVQERETVIGEFRDSIRRVLITTNVCSRGLDIPQVNLIINWNMPVLKNGSADCETYLHRIGRSGRFGKEGIAINFVTEDEMYLIHELEQHFEIRIPPLTTDDMASA